MYLKKELKMINLNTSHVKVKRFNNNFLILINIYLNTSHVKVKPLCNIHTYVCRNI